MKKGIKVLNGLLNVLLFGVLGIMIFVVIVSKASGGEANFLGYQLKIVLSGSMEPEMKTGSIIAVNPDFNVNELKEGDVITFLKDRETLVTHRITEIKGGAENRVFITKGDNNEVADLEPVLAENVVAVYTGFTIPYIGYFMNFANTTLGIALLLILPGLALLIYSGITIRSAIREIEGKMKKEDVSISESQV